MINFDRPVKAVALDPVFYRSGSGKHFVTGDDKVAKGLNSYDNDYDDDDNYRNVNNNDNNDSNYNDNDDNNINI